MIDDGELTPVELPVNFRDGGTTGGAQEFWLNIVVEPVAGEDTVTGAQIYIAQ